MPVATGVAEAMLGLPGFRVLEVTETAAELIIRIETSAELVGCPDCGVVAVAREPHAATGTVRVSSPPSPTLTPPPKRRPQRTQRMIEALFASMYDALPLC